MNAPARQGIPLRPDPTLLASAERRSWHRVLAAHALGVIKGSDPRKVLKGAWPSDERAETILKAAQTPTSTADYPVANMTGTFRSIAPGSAAWKLFDHPSALRLDLAGVNSINIPNLAALPAAPVFVGEGKPAPAVQWTFGKAELGPVRKILVMSAVSDELNQCVPETVAAIVGRVLADSANRSIDAVTFDANAGDTDRPPGLLFGVAPIAASATGNLWDNMVEDVANLVESIGNAGVDPSAVIFIAPPRQAMLLRLRTGPDFTSSVLVSIGLAANTVVAVAPAGLASGYQGPPTIETSREALLHFESAAPADIVDSAGAAASPTKSLYQTDLLALKVRANAAWCAAPGAVAVVENVAW